MKRLTRVEKPRPAVERGSLGTSSTLLAVRSPCSTLLACMYAIADAICTMCSTTCSQLALWPGWRMKIQ